MALRPRQRSSVLFHATTPPCCRVLRNKGGCCESGQIPKFSPCGGLENRQKPNFWAFQNKFRNKNVSAFGRFFFVAKQGGFVAKGGLLLGIGLIQLLCKSYSLTQFLGAQNVRVGTERFYPQGLPPGPPRHRLCPGHCSHPIIRRARGNQIY